MSSCRKYTNLLKIVKRGVATGSTYFDGPNLRKVLSNHFDWRTTEIVVKFEENVNFIGMNCYDFSLRLKKSS